MATGAPVSPPDPPPRAARFIVTVYGDIVEPRGGVLWMGSLIAICGLVGISESLVRTSVSRLVTAGLLQGEKHGRRSYYRLTPQGAAEFATASALIFCGAERPGGWDLIYTGDPDCPDAAPPGFARLGPGHFIGPAKEEPRDGLRFRVTQTGDDLTAWARTLWPLDALAERYRAFDEAHHGDAAAADPRTALALRLMLVHRWRAVVLTDPHLPASAMPADWPGFAAARTFARRYIELSPAAETAIAALGEAHDGADLVPAAALRDRQRWLEAVLA